MSILKGMLILWVFSELQGCTTSDVPPLKVGSNVWPGYELYYLARNIGKLDPNQVRLVEFSNATDVSHQLVNGNLQGGLLTLDEAIRLQQSGLNLKVVQIVDFSRGGDVVMARQALGEREEIMGKSIAVEASAVGALMMTSFVNHIQVPLDYLNVQYISVDESEKAFKSGADFIVTFEPFKTKLANLGAVQVFDSTVIPNLIVDVFVVREDVINSQTRPQIAHAIQSFFQAKEFFQSHSDEATQLMAKRLKITPEEVLSSYDGIKLADPQENEALLIGSEPDLNESITAINDILLSIKLISKSVTPESLLMENPIIVEALSDDLQ